VVYAHAVEIDAASAAASRLTFVELAELVGARDGISDAHLRVAALRLAHALGLLTRPNV